MIKFVMIYFIYIYAFLLSQSNNPLKIAAPESRKL